MVCSVAGVGMVQGLVDSAYRLYGVQCCRCRDVQQCHMGLMDCVVCVVVGVGMVQCNILLEIEWCSLQLLLGA